MLDPIKKEIRERTASYITAALGLVAGLAWNDAIKSLIDYVYPTNGGSLPAKFIYAIAITLVVIIITTYLVKLMQKREEGGQ